MKKVLFIAYYFPPIGGGGVQRSLKFVRYLPQFGFSPTVLTARSVAAGSWSPRDDALLAELPASTRIHRIAGIPALKAGGRWGRRLRESLGLRSLFEQAWSRGIVEIGSQICERERPDAIFITMSPFEGAGAAATLSRRFGIPWVADLRDPWALDEMEVYLSAAHRRMMQHRMRQALRSASLVIMNTPEAARRLVQAFPEYRHQRVISLTNGFDAADFRGRVYHRDDDRFRIVHTGSFYVERGRQLAANRTLFERLGRVEPGVDFLSRTHLHLCEALRRWRERDPAAVRQVALTLAGSLTTADREAVDASPVRELITVDGYRSHDETVQLQMDADLLFLPMQNLPPGRRASIVPGKTYEYLASQRPILAAVPEGDARDFVTGAGTGRVCAPDDVEGILAILQEEFLAWKERRPTVEPRHDFIRQFERRELTRRLAEELQLLPPAARPVDDDGPARGQALGQGVLPGQT